MRELKDTHLSLHQVPVDGLALVGAISPGRLERLRDAVQGLEEPIHLDLTLTPESDVFLLAGSVQGHVTLECESCRRYYAHALAERVSLTVDPHPDRAVHRDPSEKGEVWVVDHADEQVEAPDGDLDLLAALEDEWLLGLPLSPRCSSECLGLCPVCGADRNEAECGCPAPRRPSPFDVLAQLKTDASE